MVPDPTGAGGDEAGGDEAGGDRWLTRVVPAAMDGERLDRVLALLLAAISRTEARRLIESGAVKVAGAPALRPAVRLRPGDVLEIHWTAPSRGTAVEPEPIALDIRYEDDHLAVLDKPAGLAVHPGAGRRHGTLVAGLLARYGPLPGDPGRPGLVHRLDRLTSGLLLVARTAAAQRRLSQALAAREIERIYEALVWGEPRPPAASIDVEIARSRRDPTRMAPAPGRGRRALTEYTTLEPLRIASRLELRLRTGRTHQIRVHLAHIGHPVVGDPTYGGRPRRLIHIPAGDRDRARLLMAAIDRQALHARRLAFRHPATGEDLVFESARPADIARCLDILRSPAGGESMTPGGGRGVWDPGDP